MSRIAQLVCSEGTHTVRKTTLTDQQDDWIKAQVEGGHYTNDSEYIRDLIRREQELGAEIEKIRSAFAS